MTDEEYAEQCVQVRAKNIVSRLRIPGEFEDVCQELRVALFVRMARFNPQKAGIRTYTDRIVNFSAMRIFKKYCQIKKRKPVSQKSDNGKQSDSIISKIDTESILETLPENIRSVARRLQNGESQREIYQSIGISKWEFEKQFTRRIREAATRYRNIE